MLMLWKHYASTVSLEWLNYVTLATGIVILCGCVFVWSCVCTQCCCVSSVASFTKFCLSILKRLLVALPPIIDEYFPAMANGAGINHYILDLRPEYGTEISQIVTDIVGVLQHGLVDYPAPEKHPTHKRLVCKYDVRGWRRKSNERWKKKMMFFRRVGCRHKGTSSNNCQDDSESERSGQSEDTESSNQESFSIMDSHLSARPEEFVVEAQNSRDKYSEEFIMVPQSEDSTLEEITVYPSMMRKIDLFKEKPDGTLVPHYTYKQ